MRPWADHIAVKIDWGAYVDHAGVVFGRVVEAGVGVELSPGDGVLIPYARTAGLVAEGLTVFVHSKYVMAYSDAVPEEF
jgi:hypothetical protein